MSAPQTAADADAMTLHLDHRDALALVGDDDVHLPIALPGETDVRDHQPAVGQAIAECPNDDALLVVGEQRQREVLWDEQTHGTSLPRLQARSTGGHEAEAARRFWAALYQGVTCGISTS